MIALSTMESEYKALSDALKFVIPIQNLVSTVAQGVGLDKERLTTFKTTIWEDNMGQMTLAKLEPGIDVHQKIQALRGQNTLVQVLLEARSY
jgi:hypothetical protein